MSTPAQIAANRANAQHSTGPGTDAGKAASSRNAYRHGFYAEPDFQAERHLADGESPGALDRLWSDLDLRLMPETTFEDLLVERLAVYQWRLRRLAALEARCYASPAAPATGGTPAQPDLDRMLRQLNGLARYERTIQRLFDVTLAEYNAIRRARIREEDQAEEDAALDEEFGDAEDTDDQTPATPAPPPTQVDATKRNEPKPAAPPATPAQPPRRNEPTRPAGGSPKDRWSTLELINARI